jgi:hypothetical protein
MVDVSWLWAMEVCFILRYTETVMAKIVKNILLLPLFFCLSCDAIIPTDYDLLTYAWTKTFGGSGTDRAYALTTDIYGNIYAGGYFSGTADFDPGTGVDNKTSAGGYDAFLTRINADGSYTWTKTFGGVENDITQALTSDTNENIYVGGLFRGTADFDPGPGIDNKISAGNLDVFLTRINADGSYAWTITFGGSTSDIAYCLTMDISGNIYVGGCFSGTADFDPGPGIDNKTSAGDYDAFLTRINTDASYAWTKTFGGSIDDRTQALATDTNGNIYAAGSFYGNAVFDPDTGNDNKNSAGGYDAFLTRINSNGSYAWTKTFGGSGNECGYALNTDLSGNIYVGGSFSGTTDFNPGMWIDNKTSTGGTDIFQTKINANGSYAWTETFGGNSMDYSFALTTDLSGNVYAAGYFSSQADFDPGPAIEIHTSSGNEDCFLIKIKRVHEFK